MENVKEEKRKWMWLFMLKNQEFLAGYGGAYLLFQHSGAWAKRIVSWRLACVYQNPVSKSKAKQKQTNKKEN
jgi:hypothetical protein